MHLIPVARAKLPQALGPTASPVFAGVTLSGMTPGSVPFAGAGGLMSQDNAKLFWDNTNKRLGLGTASPSVQVHLKQNNNTTALRLERSDAALVWDAFMDVNNSLSFAYMGATYFRVTPSKNAYLNAASVGTSGKGVLVVGSDTAPTTGVTDAIQVFSQDFAPGNACPYFRTEDGTVIGLNQSLLSTASPTFAGLTISGLTAGSIPYAGASGVITQNNSGLYWDASNWRLGVGTNAPVSALHVKGSGNVSARIESAGDSISGWQAKNLSALWLLEVGRVAGTPSMFSINDATTHFFTINTSGKVGIGTGTGNPAVSGTGKLHLGGDTIRIDTARTPASAGATGNAGEICWDANYIYTCTATNTWKRAAISSW